MTDPAIAAGAIPAAEEPVAPELDAEQLVLVDRLCAEAEKPEDHWIGEAFAKQARKDALSEGMRAGWALLAAVMQMHFRAANAREPYGPLVILNDGSRSLTPADLPPCAVSLLERVLAVIADCELRARLADVLWLRTRDPGFARAAVQGYLASARRLEDPRHWPPSLERYERAARLARMLGKNDPALSEVLENVLEQIRLYRGRDPLFATCQLTALLYEFRHGDPAELAGYTLTGAEGARGRGGDPRAAGAPARRGGAHA